jgi:uncharacterized protein
MLLWRQTRWRNKSQKRSDLFHSVVQPDGGEFFERNGLLFVSSAQVKESIDGLTKAQPLISELAGDPTLRGIVRALSFAANGVQAGELKLDQLTWPLSLADKTLIDVLAGGPGNFSWQELMRGRKFKASELRRFIEIDPIQDFSALQPGAKATYGIQEAATDLNLVANYDAKIGLTGPVPLADDQFAVVKQGAFRDTMIALVGVLIILWLALRSWKIIAAVFFSLAVGLAVTPGLIMVGAFNLISIAFFVLFVGLGVDFGIQFSVRYRAERHENNDLHATLHSAARKVARPLALAAAATAVGFFSFIPTIYRRWPEPLKIATFNVSSRQVRLAAWRSFHTRRLSISCRPCSPSASPTPRTSCVSSTPLSTWPQSRCDRSCSLRSRMRTCPPL